MSVGLALSGILYPTVGLALFLAWSYASIWSRRGRKKTAVAVRVIVIAVACAPLSWALACVYRDLGGEALVLSCLAACVATCGYLCALRLRPLLDAYCRRRRAKRTPHF